MRQIHEAQKTKQKRTTHTFWKDILEEATYVYIFVDACEKLDDWKKPYKYKAYCGNNNANRLSNE